MSGEKFASNTLVTTTHSNATATLLKRKKGMQNIFDYLQGMAETDRDAHCDFWMDRSVDFVEHFTQMCDEEKSALMAR